MKSLILSLIAAVLLVSSPAAAREAASDVKTASKEGVDAALTQWKETVETGKLDAIMKLYDRNAVMISTFAQDPLTKR